MGCFGGTEPPGHTTFFGIPMEPRQPSPHELSERIDQELYMEATERTAALKRQNGDGHETA